MSKSQLSDPFFGLFLVNSEAILAIFKIRVFSATFRHEITMYAIDKDKKRFRTPFLTLQNHFENRPSTRLNFLEHLQLSHIEIIFIVDTVFSHDGNDQELGVRVNNFKVKETGVKLLRRGESSSNCLQFFLIHG